MRFGLRRDFFRCAAVWLACREHLLCAETDKDRMWHFLGEMDYQAEMALILKEFKSLL